MAGGRPTTYKPEYCEMLFEHMKEGLSFESFGGLIRAGRQTLYDWCESHPEFSYAKSEGQLASQMFWERGMRSAAFGKLPGSNMTGFVFTMKCRFGWKEADSAPQDITVNLAYNLDDE